ncbi:MAG: hypothetical protein A2Z29_10740 [Chloroflexi bacterium RBG_16_56_11]|nr:MAG: hypothetical protein A2Z29_10740 [Chloroflexi bacterium RBG_16_56_11]
MKPNDDTGYKKTGKISPAWLVLPVSVALVIIAGHIGVTRSSLVDTEDASGNQAAVGALDLKTNDIDGVSQTLYATSMLPGNTIGPSTIQLRNAGSINGSSLDIAFSYVENDGNPNSVNKNANDTAGTMEVTTLNYGGSSLLGSVSDANSNGYKDVYDLANAALSGLSGLNVSSTKNFEITVQLRSDTGTDFKADGITLTMTFTLNQ